MALSTILNKLLRRTDSGDGERVYLGAFGKHPGWDDHIEDIGLETDVLVAAKRWLYVQGVAGNVDSGAWDTLPEAHRLDRFDHAFVWISGHDVVVGRMWSSTDGKGRSRYPMVVCAHCRGLPVLWVWLNVVPLLAEIQQRCAATDSARTVTDALAEYRQRLRQAAAPIEWAAPTVGMGSGALAKLADRPEMGPDELGLFRVLYQFEREVLPRLTADGANGGAAGLLRVPVCAQPPDPPGRVWLSFLLGQLGVGTAMLVIIPAEGTWVDLIVGEPTIGQLACLRSGAEAIAPATEVPYTLGEEFLQRARKGVEASRAGADERVVDGKLAETLAAKPSSSAKVRRFRLGMPKGRFLLILAVVAALSIAGGVLLLRGGGRTAPAAPGGETAQEADGPWRQLCEKHYDWFGLFRRELDGPRRQRWRADDHLAAAVLDVLADAESRGEKLNPRELVVDQNWSLSDVATDGSMPSALHGELADPAVAAEAERALKTVAAVEKALAAQSDANPTGWPLLARAAALPGLYSRRGWAREGATLQRLSGAVTLGPGLAEAVDDLFAVEKVVTAIERDWAMIQADTKVIAAAGVDPLVRFDDYVLGRTRSPPDSAGLPGLDTLQRRVAEVAELSGELAGFVRRDWAERIDAPLLKLSPPSLSWGSKSEPIEATFRGWLASVRSGRYDKLAKPDPRPKTDTILATLRDDIEALRQRDTQGQADTLAAGLAALDEHASQLAVRRWDRTGREAILKDLAEFEKSRKALALALADALVGASRTLASYKAALPDSVAGADSAAIDASWRARRDELCEKIADLPTLRAKVEQLQKSLAALAGEIPADGVSALPDELATAGSSRRERALGEAVKLLAWREMALSATPEGARKWEQLRQDYAKWIVAAARVAGQVAVAGEMLSAGYLLDEKPPGEGATLRQLRATWSVAAGLTDAEAQSAGRPVAARLAALADVAGQQDIQRLTAMAAGAVEGRFELARAAWLRLGRMRPDWPGTPDHLRVEQKLRRNLGAVYGLLPDQARKGRLTEELLAGGRSRWRRGFAAAGDAEAIAAAIAMARDFSVDLAEGKDGSDFGALPPHGRFNYLLSVFRADSGREQPIEKLLSRRDRFVQAVRNRCPDLANGPELGGFLASLAEVKNTEDAGGDVTGVMPSPWQGGKLDERRVAFSWQAPSGRRHVLTFIRLDAPSAKPAYLCTAEATVGLFLDVVAATELSVESLLAMKRPTYEPVAWKSSQAKLALAPEWVAGQKSRGFKAHGFYPVGSTPTKPTADCPMQYVPPGVAMAFADRLGCRLPTSAEWALAARAAAKTPRNLRDRAWGRQWSHMRALEKDQGVRPKWPDQGAFRPKDRAAAAGGRDAKAATDGDDGVPWFAPAGGEGPGGFRHLVGNVAEFVYDQPAQLAKGLGPGDVTVASVVAFLAGHGKPLGVVGGSALSGPGLWSGAADAPFGKVYPVDLDVRGGAAVDVGFRLAFTAPHESADARIAGLLAEQAFLRSPKTP